MKVLIRVIMIISPLLSIAQGGETRNPGSESYRKILSSDSTVWDVAVWDIPGIAMGKIIHRHQKDSVYHPFYFYSEDFIYGDNTYMGKMREDTIEGRIWWIPPTGKQEILVMDLSLELGDTFYIDPMFPVKVDSVFIKDDRKHIRLDWHDHLWKEKLTFIEGAGPNFSMLYQIFGSHNSLMSCMHLKEERVYQTNSLYFIDCMVTDAPGYMPLLGENKVWSVAHEKHTLVGDTIINEKKYSRLYFHNYLEEYTPESLEYIAALREDLTTKQVYYIWKDHTEEVLLYDFSLRVGDPFQVNIPYFNLSGPTFSNIPSQLNREVSSVFDTIIEGISRKALKITGPWGDGPIDYWIEGIGSIYGLIYPGYELLPDRAYAVLLCLHQNNQLIYRQDDIYNPTNSRPCYSIPATNIEKITGPSFIISASPSPFRENMDIRIDYPVKEIIVFSQSGRVIFQYNSEETFTHLNIPTTHWPGGLYFIRAGNGKDVVSKKIVKL